MIRLCVLGNSHVASLKKAWDRIGRQHPEIELTFFACRGWHLFRMVAKDGRLRCKTDALRRILEFTSGGVGHIEVADYDFFLIYGADARPYFLAPQGTVSKAALAQSLRDSVDGTLANFLLTQLRSITDNKVFVGHCPLLAAKRVLSTVEPDAYLRGIAVVNAEIYEKLRAELLSQPVATIVNGVSTHPKYARGSTRLAVGDSLDGAFHQEGDRSHMNEEYGALWLSEFFSRSLRVQE